MQGFVKFSGRDGVAKEMVIVNGKFVRKAAGDQ